MTEISDLSSLKGQRLKNAIIDVLNQDNWQEQITALIDVHGAKLTTAFFSGSYSESAIISYRAISCFGFLTHYLSKQSKEKIRILMRRCIWMLTEESGGIPWRVPEIMGEIMSADKQFAEEYCDLLFSYIFENDSGPDNYLEHTPLRKSVFSSIVKISYIFPELIFSRKNIIEQRLLSEVDKSIIAMLCRIITATNMIQHKGFLKSYLSDQSEVQIYSNDSISVESLSTIATKSLSVLEKIK